MNRNFKAIGAAILAAVMCASLAGCAKEEDKPELTESNIESYIESIFDGSLSSPSSSTDDKSEPEVKIEMTDEIKNAAMGSGFVQYNNDIFQRGGYITVADFVEKYKDRYDIFYNYVKDYSRQEAPYNECKDYLLEYDKDDDIFEQYNGAASNPWVNRDGTMSSYAGNNYYLTLKPKKGGNCQPVTAYVVNATSPDEKITLDKAIVVEIESAYSHYEFITPQWFPLGLNCYKFKDKYESENKIYTVKSLGDVLEAKGLKKNADFEQSGWLLPSLSKAENFGTYWSSTSGRMGCYVLGEENLFGAKPLYYYSFNIDSNTDKLDYAECSLEYFVKE